MRSVHTLDRELGAMAARAKPRTLVLHHDVRMGGTDEEMLAAFRAGGFEGNVVFAHDLERH